MSKSKMNDLFDSLCDDFQKLLDTKESMSSADRKLLLEFLRDNEISCVGENNPKLTSIAATLPFPEENQTSINQ